MLVGQVAGSASASTEEPGFMEEVQGRLSMSRTHVSSWTHHETKQLPLSIAWGRTPELDGHDHRKKAIWVLLKEQKKNSDSCKPTSA